MELWSGGSDMLLRTQMKMHLRKEHPSWDDHTISREIDAELARAKQRMHEAEQHERTERGNYG